MRTQPILATASALCLSLTALSASAFEPQTFNHKDWDLSCDSGATCRAVGYHSDDDDSRIISLLLTRQAGKHDVTAELRIGDWEDELVNLSGAVLHLNDESLGALNFTDDTAALSAAQTQAILASLKGNSRIQVRTKDNVWTLSDAGSSAVLRKMDEIQGRVGTPSALVATGHSSKKVLPPQALPVIHAAPVGDGNAEVFDVDSQVYQDFVRTLSGKKLSDEEETIADCEDLSAPDLMRYPLSNGYLLWQMPCYMGAYQGTDYFFVTDSKYQLQQFLPIGNMGAGYYVDGTGKSSKGYLESAYKGRGLGDCWGFEKWVWTGKAFTLSESYYTGQCKGFAGGAWNLPMVLTVVK